MSSSAIGRRAFLGGAAGLTAALPIGYAHAAPADTDSTPSRIDVHCHHIPDFYRNSLAEHDIITAGGIPLPAWSPGMAVNFMDNYGIAAQVVSISEPGVTYLPTADERGVMAREINDWTRETLVATSDPRLARRFGGFAVLPLGDPDDPVDIANACAEARRAINTLDLDGIGMFSHYQGVYLGDPRLEPLMATLNSLGAFAFVDGRAGAVALDELLHLLGVELLRTVRSLPLRSVPEGRFEVRQLLPQGFHPADLAFCVRVSSPNLHQVRRCANRTSKALTGLFLLVRALFVWCAASGGILLPPGWRHRRSRVDTGVRRPPGRGPRRARPVP